MSEQIHEQISAFLDGELPSAETEMLLRRLARDAELRAYFGRCALIGEACRRTTAMPPMSRGVAARVQRALEAEQPHAGPAIRRRRRRAPRWRHAASGAVAAVVAVFAVFALQQRADTPVLTDGQGPAQFAAGNAPAPRAGRSARVVARTGREGLSYTVPTNLADTPSGLPPAELTNYVFAHSEYTSFLGQRGLLSGLIAQPEARPPAAPSAASAASLIGDSASSAGSP